MSYTQHITIRHPRRQRSRWGLGDGPVTSPSDPSLQGPVTSPMDLPGEIVGTVGPTRVPCEDLPADSPFRGPNGPCPPAGPSPLSTVTDWLRDMFGGGGTMTPTATPMAPAVGVDAGPPWLLIGAALGVGYYLYAKRKKKRSA